MVPGPIDPDAVRKRIGPYADTKTTPEERGRIYQELLGFVPPRIQGRFQVTGALDPEMVELQERMRAHNLDALVHRIIAKPFSLEEICDAVKDALALPPGAI